VKYYYEILFIVVMGNNYFTILVYLNIFICLFSYFLNIISFNRLLEETISSFKVSNQYNRFFNHHPFIFNMDSTCSSWFVMSEPANFLATLGPFYANR